MIGNIIQTKRKEIGLTQAQLAGILGVSAPAVNKWEKDLCFPDAALLAPLARLLKTDMNELFSFYEVLSDKERELIGITITKKYLDEGIKETLAYIDDVLKQNPSDGILFKEIADKLCGMHMLVRGSSPEIYLKEITEYYEKALNLAPEYADEIAYALMNVYSELGDSEKAERSWERLSVAKYDKNWTHSEMLYNLKKYDDAIPEIRESILRKAIDLSRNLMFYSENLKLAGEEGLSVMALEKAKEMSSIFELWEGINATNDMASNGNIVGIMKRLFESCDKDTEISASPLFKGVSLKGDSTPDILNDLLQVIKEKQ